MTRAATATATAPSPALRGPSPLETIQSSVTKSSRYVLTSNNYPTRPFFSRSCPCPGTVQTPLCPSIPSYLHDLTPVSFLQAPFTRGPRRVPLHSHSRPRPFVAHRPRPQARPAHCTQQSEQLQQRPWTPPVSVHVI